MTKRAMVAATMCCVLLSTSALGAQPPSVPAAPRPIFVDRKLGMGVEEAVSRALQAEPSLRAASAEVEAARAMRVQAGLRPNPTLSFERRQSPTGMDSQTMASVQWPLDLFRRDPRISVRDAEVTAAEQAVMDRRRTLAADVRMRYGQAAAAAREVAIVDEVVGSIRRQYELLARRVTEGAAPPLERDLLDVELRRLEAEQWLAVARVEAALFELRRTMGLPSETSLRLKDSVESLIAGAAASGAAPAVPSVGDTVVTQRADVLEAAARVRTAAARIEQARSAGRVDVSLVGGYMGMDMGFAQRGVTEQGTVERVRGQFHYLSAGAMVTVPFGNRNQGEIGAAEAERRAQEARREAVELSVQSEIAAAMALEARARQALAAIEAGVDLSRRNLEVTRETYELGRLTVSDVLTEQRRFLEIERAHTDTLRAAYEAQTALRRARGEQ